jgi:pyruvate dehydrogenase E2 component (dihydrolipoamide acetyltransferase)
MAEIIEMPKLSDTMTVGTLVKWLKKEGDKVKSGDILCEVETDKATMEVENFANGVILKHYVPAGGQIPVGAPMCAVGQPGEKAPDAAPAVAAKAPAAPKEAVPAKPAEPPPPAPAPVASPASVAPSSEPVSAPGTRIKASPLAKKVAAETGVSLAGLTGSGPGGRIRRVDVLAAASKPPAPASASGATTTFAASGGPLGQDEKTPVSNMRAAIARHLLKSKTEIPHFYLELEIDAGPLTDMREGLNVALADVPPEKGGGKFTVNDFILKASIEALRRVPAVNASWMGDHIQRHGRVHLAFGVALEDGLVTPVIKNADSKSIRQISVEARELAAKARGKKIKPDEMTGSTLTVTNLGMFGITGFFGIINPPNAAILSVGATVKKPVVDAHNQIVIGRRMSIGLAGDHRVIDGAVAAQYLQALRTLLETPALLLLG